MARKFKLRVTCTFVCDAMPRRRDVIEMVGALPEDNIFNMVNTLPDNHSSSSECESIVGRVNALPDQSKYRVGSSGIGDCFQVEPTG